MSPCEAYRLLVPQSEGQRPEWTAEHEEQSSNRESGKEDTPTVVETLEVDDRIAGEKTMSGDRDDDQGRRSNLKEQRSKHTFMRTHDVVRRTARFDENVRMTWNF